MTRPRPTWPSLLLTALATLGCGGPRTTEAPAQVLRVAAASDLQDVLPELASRFEAEHPVQVEYAFGSSGRLKQQIEAGAPFDLFLSANRAFVSDLASTGMILPDSVRAYTQGALVLVIYRDSGESVQSLADLTKPEVQHLALANPELAPYGAAARQALQNARLWDELQPKLAQAETVRQALQYVQTGNAEAGLVGRAIARRVPEVRTIEIDPSLYAPIVQTLGVVAHSEQTEAARQFADFLLGSEGQAVLQSHGFDPPTATPTPEPRAPATP